MLRAAAILVLGLAALAAGDASAQDALTLSLDWRVGPGARDCPDAATLAEMVTAELGRDPFAEGDAAPASRRVEVAVDADPAIPRHGAVLTVRDAEGDELGQREIESSSRTCDELAAAVVLSLVLLAGGGDAMTAILGEPAPSEPAPTSGPEPGPEPPESTVDQVVDPTADPTALAEPPPAAPPPNARREAAPDAGDPPRARALPSPRAGAAAAPAFPHVLGLAGGVRGGVLPSPVAELRALAWLRPEGWPVLRLEAAITDSATARLADAPGARTDLSLLHGGAGACPLDLRGLRLSAGACALLRAGAALGRGAGFAVSHDEAGLWIALAAEAWAELRLVGPVVLFGGVEIAPAVVRSRFVAQRGDESLEMHRVPVVGWGAHLGLGVHLGFENPAATPTTP